MHLLQVREGGDRGGRGDDWGRGEETKGLRNYAALYFRTVPLRVNLVYLLLANKQYNYYHAFNNYVVGS